MYALVLRRDGASGAPPSLDDRELNILFQGARTPNGFLDQSVPLSLVQHRPALANIENSASGG
jgi:hypothetical protein